MGRNSGMDMGIVASALKACMTREQVNNLFTKLEVVDLPNKIEALNKCMEADETFFSAGDGISLDDKYELTLQMFELGEWR